MTKRLAALSDLALFGAPQAYAEPLHVGRPNIGRRERILELIGEALDRRWLSNNGPLAQAFEAELARRLGVRHVLAMCNATIALEIAIRALDLKGEVIVPSYTFVATAHALQWQQIEPVFADIDPVTHSLDPAAVRRMITPRTTGIIGVHLWGRACDVAGLQQVADDHGLQLMYDAAHAFGTSIGGAPVGGFGRCEVFSFHATKFLNSFEGGAVATNDDALATKIALMRNFGFAGYDNVVYPGTNGKITEVCAAMGLASLETIDEVIEANRRNRAAYRIGIAGLPGLSLFEYDDGERNNWQYVVLQVDAGFGLGRDELVAMLHSENVLARKYFWPGCHAMQPYRDLYPDAARHLPNTLRVAEQVIVLPTGTAVSEADVATICGLLALAARPEAAAAIRARLASAAG
ncbi:MAG: DegT/DnrJ/EryC1/StrS family aminotransferase [Aquabacterium sp.]